MLKALFESVVQLVFPSHCPSCGAYTEQQGQWCENCFAELITMDSLTYHDDVRQYISPIFAMGKYEKGLKSLIHELKYEGKIGIGKYLEPYFYLLEEELDFSRFDLVVPVPLHEAKLKKRGYNQVDVIFKEWCKSQGLVYHEALLRVRNTSSQYALDYEARQGNLHRAFALQPNVDIKNKTCLLVDDIFTTGSTLKHCAQVLLDQGAKSVSGLVLASNANE